MLNAVFLDFPAYDPSQGTYAGFLNIGNFESVGVQFIAGSHGGKDWNIPVVCHTDQKELACDRINGVDDVIEIRKGEGIGVGCVKKNRVAGDNGVGIDVGNSLCHDIGFQISDGGSQGHKLAVQIGRGYSVSIHQCDSANPHPRYGFGGKRTNATDSENSNVRILQF